MTTQQIVPQRQEHILKLNANYQITLHRTDFHLLEIGGFITTVKDYLGKVKGTDTLCRYIVAKFIRPLSKICTLKYFVNETRQTREFKIEVLPQFRNYVSSRVASRLSCLLGKLIKQGVA